MDVLIALIAVFVLLAFVAVITVRAVLHRKKTGLVVCLSLVMVVLVVAFVFLWNFNDDSVTIKSSDDKDFSINIKNHKQNYEYHYEDFSCDLSMNEMLNQVKKQYASAVMEQKNNSIMLVTDNNIYTLERGEKNFFEFIGRYNYTLSCNVVSLDMNNTVYTVPFPINCIDETVEVNSNPLKINCDFETLKGYYENFSDVEFDNNSISFSVKNIKYLITYNDSISEVSFDVI